MAERYDLWIHGTDVNVQEPSRTTTLRPYGWGTEIEQDPGTGNWFHFASPTPTIMHDEEDNTFVYDRTDEDIMLQTIWVVASSNRNTTIDRVDAWDGHDSFMNKTGLSLQGLDEHQEPFDVTHHINYGLNVSIHVRFTDETPYPKVTFHGVGAQFMVDS